jgi:hypothetical protein
VLRALQVQALQAMRARAAPKAVTLKARERRVELARSMMKAPAVDAAQPVSAWHRVQGRLAQTAAPAAPSVRTDAAPESREPPG